MRFAGTVCVALLIGIVVGSPSSAATAWLSRDAQLQDLELVRTSYLPKEMAYTPETLSRAEAKLRQMEERAGSLSADQFMTGLAQVGAFADNAHSGLRYHDPRALPAARLPMRLLWFPDGLLVARATGATADLAGARVLRIENRSPQALYERVKVLLGGKAVNRKRYLPEFIESFGVLHDLGLAKASDRLSFTLLLANGQTVVRTIPMVPTGGVSPTAEEERLFSPEPVVKESGWRAALATDRIPLYLRDADQPFRMIALPKALYVQFRSNEDEDGHPIAPFLEQVKARLKAERPQNLILDLRFDVGGNLTTTTAFMHLLPTLIPGRIFMLVGPYTFSAGIISAATVKLASGNRVAIVGDEIGDRPHFWSEGDVVKLPNSHFAMRFTNGQFDLEKGCTGLPACMNDFVRTKLGIGVDFVSFVPDIAAPITLKAYLGDRDPAMEAVDAELAR
jgi:hypothetical protein